MIIYKRPNDPFIYDEDPFDYSVLESLKEVPVIPKSTTNTVINKDSFFSKDTNNLIVLYDLTGIKTGDGYMDPIVCYHYFRNDE